MVRTTLTEPKTALAGVILEISFARSKASMSAMRECHPDVAGTLDPLLRSERAARERRGTYAVAGRVTLIRMGGHSAMVCLWGHLTRGIQFVVEGYARAAAHSGPP